MFASQVKIGSIICLSLTGRKRMRLASKLVWSLSMLGALSCAQSVQAASHAKNKVTVHKDSVYKDQMPVVADNWDPLMTTYPSDYPQFLRWAEDINSVKSNEPLFSCWNGILCVSGLLDLDAVYFNSKGYVFGPAASPGGVGVRPVFGGDAVSQLIGSINNANILADLNITDFARIHSNLAYMNGAIKENSYAWHKGADWGSVYRPSASVKADELYVVFADPSKFPVYFKVGRMYLDFGTYIPNGDGLPTITPSLTQLMTQVRTGGAQLGLALQNGLYGSATWSMAQQSILPSAARNYSAKLGYMHQFTEGVVNANASFIWDLRDADYINDTLNYLNIDWANRWQSSFSQAYTSRKQHAFAVHLNSKYKQFGFNAEGAASTGHLNKINPDSTLWTAGADVSYDFPTFGHRSNIDLGYQIARHTMFVTGTAPGGFPPVTGATFGPFYNMLPESRIVATYIFKVAKHVNTALQWVHDQDFSGTHGTGESSDFGVFRIDLEF